MSDTVDSASAPSDSVHYFHYDQLPSSTSIRLLELYTQPGRLQTSVEMYDWFDSSDIVTCKLHTLDVNGSILYDALSYTWENPLGVYHSKEEAGKAVQRYKVKVPILCNNSILEVGANLYDALVMLRKLLRSSQHTMKDLHSDFEARPLTRQLVWIDAVCINQQNIPERNQQVQIMEQIYRCADAVLIWLGPGDNFSTSAVHALTALAKTPPEQAKNFSFPDSLNSEDATNSGPTSISITRWLHLFAFFERRWFRRAWIVQEVILAKVGIVLCGTVVLPWSSLARAAFWINETACYPRIWMAGIKASSELLTPDTGMYMPHEEIDGFDAIATIRAIANVRGGFKRQDVGMVLKVAAKPTLPLDLLSRFRKAHCLDPRDKVYSLLSLWPHSFKVDQTSDGIHVDYNKPLSSVYTEVARYILRRDCNLRILSHATCATLENRATNLPSWVPDWSQRSFFQHFDTQIWLAESKHTSDGEIPFNAAADCNFDSGLMLNSSLHLLTAQGLKLGNIKTIATFDAADLAKMVSVLSEIPVMYPYFHISAIEDDDPLVGTTPSTMPESLAQQMNRLVLHESLNSSEPAGAVARARREAMSSPPEKITSNYKVVDVLKISRFEALWRTVIADVWNHEHPAPRDAGHAFVHSLIDDMHDLLARSQRVLNAESTIHPAGASGMLLDLLETTVNGTGTSLEEIEIAWQKRITILQALAKDEEMCLSHYDGDPDEKPLRYLPDITSSEDVLDYEFDRKKAQHWRVHQRPQRVLFATTNLKLGSGPPLTLPQDEVWLLKGARYPFILRPRGNGHHMLIGEAYVHGIMHGEALWFAKRDFTEIILE